MNPPPPPPLHVQPLEYVTPADRGRPGLLTAIAILSILIGAFSILISGGMTLQGVGVAVMSVAAPTTPPVQTTPATAPVVAALSPQDVSAVIAYLEQAGGGTLTRQQRDWLQDQLTGPQQTLLQPQDVTPFAEQIDYVGIDPDGELSFTTVAGSTVGVSSDATRTFSFSFDGMGAFNPFSGVTLPLAVAATATSFASAALAAVLIGAAIQVLRDRRAGRTMHLWYAWGKIVVGIAAAVAWYALYSSMFSSLGNAGGPAAPVAMTWFSLMMIFPFVLSLIYPLVLLFVLNRPSLRQYQSALP